MVVLATPRNHRKNHKQKIEYFPSCLGLFLALYLQYKIKHTMTKQSALKQLETVMSKLSKLNYHIEGNLLGDAIRSVAYARGKLQGNQVKVRK